MLQLEIDTSNAAFADDPVAEISRILRNLVARLDDGQWESIVLPLRDLNGNVVGEARYRYEEG